MVSIQLKGDYAILGELHCQESIGWFKFSVPGSSGNPVEVIVVPKESRIEAVLACEITEEILRVLDSGVRDASKLSDEDRKEIMDLRRPLSSATRAVLSQIKYFLEQVSVEDRLFSVKGERWSVDGVNWRTVPRLLTATIQMTGTIRLDEESASALQGHLDDGVQPLLALKYLHRAWNENNQQFRWIDATIAAELAVKEFLIRIEPKLEKLLLEVPSPPLDKLYGPILKHYAGGESPKLKQIREGMQVRNRILHRPQSASIDSQEATIYVQDVAIAIDDLVCRLHSKDPIVSRLASHRPKVGVPEKEP